MDAVLGFVMKELDNFTCKNITPSIDLMETAGKKIAEAILKKYNPKKVLVLCGSSGNGGDGFVIGRYLLLNNVLVDAFLISDNLSKDCNTNKMRFNGKIYKELPKLEYDLIVDGLIGIGLKSNLRDEYINIINKVNESNIKIASIDIPTGIDASYGISYGAYIKSDTCYSIEYPKTGLFLDDGIDSYNSLEIIPIGIIKTEEVIHINTKDDFKKLLPKRLNNTNKGSFGRALIIAGSYKYPGASLISYMAQEQFKMGIGYSYLAVPKDLYELYALRHPEVIVMPIPSVDGHIKFDIESLNSFLKMDSIAIGMGMDISKDLYDTIKYLLLNYEGTIIIDADAINTIAKYGVDILKNKKCKCIITPHLKEMERLTNISVKDIKNNIFDVALNFSKEYDVTLILKSSSSIITDGKSISISKFGNSSLAKGGSGDTLSGILSGISAYLKIDPYRIACFGSYILGRSAELVVNKIEEECVTPLDISNEINNVFKEIKNE